MPKHVRRDWTGAVQGSLKVTEYAGTREDGQAMWRCICVCGTECVKSNGNLRLGVKSCSTKCGVVMSNKARAVHGGAHGKEWKAWQAAKQRCFNSNHPNYKHYGGRGITMCAEWVSDFSAFLEHIGLAPLVHRISIDRIDNDGNYEPGNVRWATPYQQVMNRRNTRKETAC